MQRENMCTKKTNEALSIQKTGDRMYYDSNLPHRKNGEEAYTEAKISWFEKKLKNILPKTDYSPYIKTLDDRLAEVGITREDIYKVKKPKTKQLKGKEYKDVETILLDRIKGSVDPGRKDCMDSEFRPTAKRDTPFAISWQAIYEKMRYQQDAYFPAIDVIEFLHDYYVEDGNKRVSVSTFLNRSAILAHTKRMIPTYDPTNKEICEYYEFLQFEKRTGISCIWFSEEGKFHELEQMIDHFTPDSFDSDPQAKDKYHYFVSNIFFPFVNEYKQLGGKNYGVEKGDIFLRYLEETKDPENLKPKQIKRKIRDILHRRDEETK